MIRRLGIAITVEQLNREFRKQPRFFVWYFLDFAGISIEREQTGETMLLDVNDYSEARLHISSKDANKMYSLFHDEIVQNNGNDLTNSQKQDDWFIRDFCDYALMTTSIQFITHLRINYPG